VSKLTDLIAKAKAKDAQLGTDLEREFRALSSRLSFGLNFERHRPEAVELPQRQVRRGDKVRILPPRGSSAKSDQQLWLVKSIHKHKKTADLRALDATETETQTVALDDLVVVAEFRDTIYPGLVSTGSISRCADKPWHTVINGENYHVLKALTWTHRGKVDAIYIDPPYNTGAKDWKYNNDYVEGEDLYRHSKWLAMMERRLLLAKELLNPMDSVLIVTIDEKEYLRLGLLLEQLFTECRIQMVTTVTNQRGVARGQEFARVDEYAFAVFIGDARVNQSGDDRLTSDATIAKQRIDIWNRLMRRGTDSLREDSPNQFYPIFIDPNRKAIVDAGQPLALNESRENVVVPDGLIAVWPIRTNGSEGRWTLGVEKLRDYAKKGMAKVGAYNKKRSTWSISYLISKDIKRIEDGEICVVGRDENGVLQLALAENTERRKLPRTVWFRDAHNAGTYGSELRGKFIPGRKFPFAKSLYLVEDMLSAFVSSKANATILDFFSGSGTTAHAVMRLNRHDGGKRQCISVTNNEVGADEQKALREQGLRPGDVEWEKWGICDYITKPRVHAAITGNTPDGVPVKGDYQFGNTVEKEIERSFKQIGFTDPNQFDTTAKKKQLVALVKGLPQTLVTGSCPFIVSEEHTSSILFDTQFADKWLDALEGQEHISDFYVVTPVKNTFDRLKQQVTELLGPIIVNEVEKLPMSDGFEENAEFFTLTYETPIAVSYQTAFAHIAPLLWLRAGSIGSRIEKLPAAGWEVTDAYGLLIELDKATDFLKAVRNAKALRIAYIVTDDERRFQALARRLPERVEAVRLYESYLTNFAFANGDNG
jgi:adenine-specific DNA-methyltransferase